MRSWVNLATEIKLTSKASNWRMLASVIVLLRKKFPVWYALMDWFVASFTKTGCLNFCLLLRSKCDIHIWSVALVSIIQLSLFCVKKHLCCNWDIKLVKGKGLPVARLALASPFDDTNCFSRYSNSSYCQMLLTVDNL